MLKVRHALRGIDFENRDNYYTHFFAKLALSTRKSVEDLRNWYFHIFYPIFIKLIKEKCTLRPQLSALLKKLKERDIKMAVLSDYNFVEERLEALQLELQYFDVLASNEEYGVLKPSKRPLETIAYKMGIEPAKILMVGDKESTDGAGALLAGMPFVNINYPTEWLKFYEMVMKI
jgi:FMN phosphatase YigB (HAD superfamily)